MQTNKIRKRGFKPNWKPEVHLVSVVEGSKVKDADGKTYKTKDVLPVKSESSNLEAPKYAVSGSAQVDAKRRATMDKFVKPFENYLSRQEDKTMLIGESAKFSRSDPDFAQALLKAKINYSTFIKLFPDKFEIDGNEIRLKGTAQSSGNGRIRSQPLR